MAVTMTSIRLDTDLADEAVKVLKAKSRTAARNRRAEALQDIDEKELRQTQVLRTR